MPLLGLRLVPNFSLVQEDPSNRNAVKPAAANLHKKVTSKDVPSDNVYTEADKIQVGRFRGYSAVVTKGRSHKDAILLDCDNDPEQYLANARDANESVEIRWLFADRNERVSPHSVKLKLVAAPPLRTAARKSSLLTEQQLKRKYDFDEAPGASIKPSNKSKKPRTITSHLFRTAALCDGALARTDALTKKW